MRFDSPLAFLLLALIPLLIWLRARGCRRATLRFSSTAHARKLAPSWRQRLLWLPTGLRVLVLALLVVVLARPQEGKEEVRERSEGIAIEMVVDRSGSMGTEMDYAGERMNRLEVVKRVFADFVQGDGDEFRGRPNDLIGMIAFARYADTVCPLTLAHGALSEFLTDLQLVRRRNEDGTAVGDAIALAAARLKTAEEDVQRQYEQEGERAFKLKSKVMILLTDGAHNAGRRMPAEAAALASDYGVRIYAIGVGGDEGVMTVQTMFGPRKFAMGGGVDQATLRAAAEATGGRFFMAENAEALRKIYSEIDELERSDIESTRYLDYRELFAPWLYLAMALLAAEILLRATLFRTSP